MASATETFSVIEVKVEKQVPTVTLVLTPDEAQALIEVAHRVGGSPSKSPRGHVDQVNKALRGLGYEPTATATGGYHHAQLVATGGIDFKDSVNI